MISENVPDKWQHKGIPAERLGDEVKKYVEKIGPAYLMSHVKGYLK
jgi:hypothetical protein